MRELSLLSDLLKKIDEVVNQNHARRAKSAKVRLGALAQISSDHSRGHSFQATAGTPAEGARLDIDVLDDIEDQDAQDIMFVSLEVET